jgi:DNA-binding beta-propeller fold protein YncE
MKNPFWKRIFLFSVGLLATACSPVASPVVWQTEDLVWVAPPAPEQARVRFLRQISGLGDIRKEDSQNSLLKWISGEKDTELPILSPYGVAADGKGRIWVADPGTGVVHVIDLGRKRIDYLSAFDGRQLVSPVGVAYDPVRKKLYVSDSGLQEILKFDENRRYLGRLQPAQPLQRPGGMALDGAGRLYVADALAGTIQVFSASGAPLPALGSALTADGKFNRPTNVVVDRQGRVYVVDAMNFRVEVLGVDGEDPVVIGRLGSVPGSFARPRGIALDSEGHVYVSDAAFDNVQIFDRQGRLLLILAGGEKSPGQLCMPAGMSFDAQDRLYVVGSCGYRVKVFQYLGGNQ